MTIPWSAKDPGESLPYTIDWTSRLGGETITGTPSWSVVGGGASLTISDPTNTTTMTQITLSGGWPGRTYTILHSITATNILGPLIERATIRIKEK